MTDNTSRAEFYQFYARHQNLVRGVLYNMVGRDPLDDLTQETFLKLWQKLDEFRGESQLTTWIYKITLNVARDFLRSEKAMKRTRFSKEEYKDFLMQNSTDASFRSGDVEQALLQLSTEHRETVVLFYFEEKTLLEIGNILDIPLGTVKSRLNTARKRIEELLTAEGVSHETFERPI